MKKKSGEEGQRNRIVAEKRERVKERQRQRQRARKIEGRREKADKRGKTKKI